MSGGGSTARPEPHPRVRPREAAPTPAPTTPTRRPGSHRPANLHELWWPRCRLVCRSPWGRGFLGAGRLGITPLAVGRRDGGRSGVGAVPGRLPAGVAAEPGLTQHQIHQRIRPPGGHRPLIRTPAAAGVLIQHREHAHRLSRRQRRRQSGHPVAFRVEHHPALAPLALPPPHRRPAVHPQHRAADRGAQLTVGLLRRPRQHRPHPPRGPAGGEPQHQRHLGLGGLHRLHRIHPRRRSGLGGGDEPGDLLVLARLRPGDDLLPRPEEGSRILRRETRFSAPGTSRL